MSSLEFGTPDVIVIGSGAAGMAAAAVAATHGLRVLVLEQSAWVGGTTAISGGMVWIPANHKMAVAGLRDSLEDARQYLSGVMPPGTDTPTLEAFLAHGDEALRYLESHGVVQLRSVVRYPDYYPQQLGATAGGRVLESMPFDASALGADFARLRPPLPEIMLFGGMMISRADIPHLRRAGRSLRSTWHVARLLGRHLRERLRAPRGTTLVLGNALAGRMLLALQRLGVEVRTGVSVNALEHQGGRIIGVDAMHDGDSVHIPARCAVILATGGLSHSPTLRARFLPEQAGALTATIGPGASPCGAELAIAARSAPGVAAAQLSTSIHQQAFWVPVSKFNRRDGTPAVYPHTVADRSKPGLIAVDASGRRFTNEARSYHEFARAQLQHPAVPAWLVCDRRFLWRYGLGRIKPFTRSVQAFVASGYLKQAPTLSELAGSMGLPPGSLDATVEAFNVGARRGIDADFGRGGDIYQQHLGDAEHGPNPCVAPLESAPFHAVQVWPADLGMAAGLVTDTQARVLDADGAPIAGLYACGNDMQSVMGGAYAGPGITLGPALVFGYLAAQDIARRAAC